MRGITALYEGPPPRKTYLKIVHMLPGGTKFALPEEIPSSMAVNFSLDDRSPAFSMI